MSIIGKDWDETVEQAHRILQERARRTAEAIIAAGKRPLKLMPMERLTEHQAGQAQRSEVDQP
jgi:hypothetical protein